jgi:integrase/recombinase XerD
MTTVTSSNTIATAEPPFTSQERLALAGFLAGYTGLTRDAYALDLRQFSGWCQKCHIRLFEARRADIECFARELEARGRARATITRRTTAHFASSPTVTKVSQTRTPSTWRRTHDGAWFF